MINAGCDHRMRAEASSCVCPGCGTVCEGRFKGCPDVWASRTQLGPPVAVVVERRAAARPAPEAPPPTSGPRDAQIAARDEPLRPSVETPPASPPRKQKDASIRLRAEANAMRAAMERSVEAMTAELAERAREIDDRAAARLREIEHDRLAIPGELRKSIAEVLPGLVAEAVRIALDARRADHTADHAFLSGEARRAAAEILPGMIADALDTALASLPADDSTMDPLHGTGPRQENDPVVRARQRSLEKRLDGLTRRAQEIDDRVTTHLRALDDDRAAFSDVARRHDQLAEVVAGIDAAGHNQRLADWVTNSVPGMVADAVRAAIDADGAAMAAAVEGVERARVEAKATVKTVQELSEGLLETLSRRDQDLDDRVAAHREVMEEQQAALASLLEGGRNEVTKSVIRVLPPMVDSAVRAAVDRYSNERRAPLLELVGRLRADADIMRESLQRSFEKMMESLAVREQELDERTAAHVRAVDEDKSEQAARRSEVERSLAEALPRMVADGLRSAEEEHRAELDAVRQDAERLHAESAAATTELREAVAELRVAVAAQRSEAVERQAAASRSVLEDARPALAARSTVANGRLRAAPSLAAPRSADPAAEPMYELEATVVSPTTRRPVGRSSPVPRARRVERRMLKIDDSDEEPWRPLDRRQAELSELLDRQDD